MNEAEPTLLPRRWEGVEAEERWGVPFSLRETTPPAPFGIGEGKVPAFESLGPDGQASKFECDIFSLQGLGMGEDGVELSVESAVVEMVISFEDDVRPEFPPMERNAADVLSATTESLWPVFIFSIDFFVICF